MSGRRAGVLWVVALSCVSKDDPPAPPPVVPTADTGHTASDTAAAAPVDLPVVLLSRLEGLFTLRDWALWWLAAPRDAGALRATGGELWLIGETRGRRYTPPDWVIPTADWNASEPLDAIDYERCGPSLWIASGTEVRAYAPETGARTVTVDLALTGDPRASLSTSLACAGDHLVVGAADPGDLGAPGRVLVLAADGAVTGEVPVGPAPRVDPDPTQPTRPWLRVGDRRNELLRFDVAASRVEPAVAALPAGVSVLTLTTAANGTAVLATRSSAAALDVRAGAWCVSPDGTVRSAPPFTTSSIPVGISVDSEGRAWVLVTEAPTVGPGDGWLWPIDAATCAPTLPEPLFLSSGLELLGVAAW